MERESKAFVLDPARFYIHTRDRYPQGNVDTAEYESLRQKITEDLLSLNAEGEKVIKEVLYREDIYSGSLYDRAPDIVALPYEGYDLKGSINKSQIFGKGFLTGGHTRENAVFYINKETNTKDINIVDIGPTIMSLLNVGGFDFDGKCLI
jgi:predicted AlkP superfamily phosphohydrolase/phosphomutase